MSAIDHTRDLDKRASWADALLDIPESSSPENAIKRAYDFARGLRINGADPADFRVLLDSRTRSFADTAIIDYIRCGFTAGFFFEPLPWKRAIDEARGAVEPFIRRCRVGQE